MMNIYKNLPEKYNIELREVIQALLQFNW